MTQYQKVHQYVIPFTIDSNARRSAIIEREYFRPKCLRTNVSNSGLGEIDGIYYTVNQLLMPLDLWEFSYVHLDLIQTQFLEKHGLKGKPTAQIQRYLDENELSMPDLLQLELPSLKKGDRVTITGRFPPDAPLQWIGYAP